MAMRYGNSWGLTVQRGPWREKPSDLNYGTVNQKHAGHGNWYQVERPSMNPAGSYSIPTTKQRKILYSATNEYTPKSRPGRLQKSVYSEGMRKELSSRPTTGLGQSTVDNLPPQGFRLGGGNFDSPVDQSESVKDEDLSRFYTMGTVGDFGNDVFYTPVGSFNPSTPTIKEEPESPSVYGTPTGGRPPPIDTSMGGGYQSLSSVVAPTVSPISTNYSPGGQTISDLSSIYAPQQYLDPVGFIQVESSPAVGIVDTTLPVTSLLPELQIPPVDPVNEEDVYDDGMEGGNYKNIIGNLVMGYPQSVNTDMIVQGQPYFLDDGSHAPVVNILRLAGLVGYYVPLVGSENVNYLADYLSNKMDQPDADQWLRTMYSGMQEEISARSGPATTRSGSNMPGPVVEPVQSVTNITNINEQQPLTEEAQANVDEDEEDSALLALLDPLNGINVTDTMVEGVFKDIIFKWVKSGQDMGNSKIVKWLQITEPAKYQEWYVNNLRWKDKQLIQEQQDAEEEAALEAGKSGGKSGGKNPPSRKGK